MDLSQYESNAGVAPPDVPEALSQGFPQSGNPSGPVAPTVPGPYWFYQWQQEMTNLFIAAGIVPDHENLNQLTLAIQALTGGGSVPTGTLLPFYGSAAPDGFILVDDGTIGSTASGASTRANDDTEDLYTLLYNSISDTWAPVVGGRDASAAADFAADKELTIPATLGRALAIAGAGSGLSARALGEWLGEEDHIQLLNEIGEHRHSYTNHQGSPVFGSGGTGGGSTSKTTGYEGDSDPFNIMQPTTFINAIIKL